MNLSDLGNVIAKYSPELGALIPLPGKMGEAALKLVAKAFGGNTDPQSIASAIEQDPQARIKLIEMQSSLILSMRQAEVEDHKAEVEDRKSARELYLNLNKDGDPSKIRPDKTPRNIAYLVISAFVISIFTIPFLPIDKPESHLMGILVGMLAGKFSSICDFFFSDSKLSQSVMTSFDKLIHTKSANDKKLDLPKPQFHDAA